MVTCIELSNQKKALEQMAADWKLEKYEDWYDVPTSKMQSTAARQLLEIYGNSMYSLLSAVLPEHPWKPWLFKDGKVPKNYWNIQHQR
jgi:hypothetical protein